MKSNKPLVFTRLRGTSAIRIDSFVNIPEFINAIDRDLQKANNTNMKNPLVDDGLDTLEKSAEDVLEKGAIADSFKWGDGRDTFKFEKSGKEIKEELPGIIEKLKSIQTSADLKMTALKAKISFDPDQPAYYSGMDLISKKMDNVPKAYSWEKCYQTKEDGMSISGNVSKPSEDQMNCVSYNEQLRIWVDVTEDILTLEMLAKNLSDTKKYTLTINQMFLMGL